MFYDIGLWCLRVKVNVGIQTIIVSRCQVKQPSVPRHLLSNNDNTNTNSCYFYMGQKEGEREQVMGETEREYV